MPPEQAVDHEITSEPDQPAYGMQRFAQQALGHNSKAVHHAYSKHAEVTVPSLDDWEKSFRTGAHAIDKTSVVPVDFQALRDGPVSGVVAAPTGCGGGGVSGSG